MKSVSFVPWTVAMVFLAVFVMCGSKEQPSVAVDDSHQQAKEVIAYVVQDHLPPHEISEIYLINSDGSGKTQLTNQPARRSYNPAYSPDGTRIACYTHVNSTTWSLWIMNSDGDNIQQLTSSANRCDWMPRWSPDGNTIIFTRSYINPTWRSELWTVKPDGTDEVRLGKMEGEGAEYSPDGSKITFSTYSEGGGDVWMINIDGTNPVKLTTHPSEDWHPRFSPDGSKIAFESKRDGNFEIYVMKSDGSNQVRLTNNSAEDVNADWSADGSRIAFVSERDGHAEVYIMNADGTNQTRLTHTNGRAINPEWKPIPRFGK
jgi:TolB protein